MDSRFSLLENAFAELNINYSQDTIQQFSDYYDLLIEWNSFMNLTAITDLNDVIIKHFVDSIIVSKFVDFSGKSIIDIGTGAGFPGIPLKILFPDSNIVLIDSLNKRINFLNTVIDKLSLKNISCFHGRAEDYAHNPKFREKFDFSVSRAVANLSVLSEYCIPFVKKDGYFVSYKSDDIDVELVNACNAIKVLNSKIYNVYDITLPFSDINRKFVFIKKYDINKKMYPRKAGVPSKNPL